MRSMPSKLQYPVRGESKVAYCILRIRYLGTSLVGSSPSSLLRSGSVSAKELESVRRIEGSASGSLYPVPGREIPECGSEDGNALDPGEKDS